MRLLLLTLALTACGDTAPMPAPAPPPTAHASVDFDDPSTCATCHATVVDEWRTSMHARAHHDQDPIYAAMRTLRMNKQGAQIAGECLTCHNPRSPTDADTPAGKQGVSCATCHAATAVDRSKGMGAAALTFSQDTLRSARDVAPGASPAHGTGPAAPHLADGTTMCLTCHDATENGAGVASCTTGPEYASAEQTQTCTTCHMPRLAGSSGSVSTRADHPSHAFIGPHAAWQGDASFLTSAADLTVALDAGTATVTLVNRTAHAYPTGFPGRMASLVVRGFDAAGAEVWSSLGPDGLPTPDALLNKVYVDAEGKPVAAPFATALKRDNRLAPSETRTIPFPVPAAVVRVEAQLRFHLLAPKLAETLGLADTPEAKPQVVARAESAIR